MRKLRCLQIPGLDVQEVIDEFNERAAEFGVTDEADIVSVSALATTSSIPIVSGKRKGLPTVDVVFVFWGND